MKRIICCSLLVLFFLGGCEKASHYPLHKACREGNKEQVKKLLNDKNINDKDSMGCTPLHCAVMFELDYQLLLQAVCCNDVSQQALNELARYHNFLEIWYLLVKAGADMSIQDNELRTPLHYVIKNDSLCLNETTVTILHLASVLSSAVNFIDCFQNDTMNAALHVADYLGNYPINYAMMNKRYDLVHLLREHGSLHDSRLTQLIPEAKDEIDCLTKSIDQCIKTMEIGLSSQNENIKHGINDSINYLRENKKYLVESIDIENILTSWYQKTKAKFRALLFKYL